MSDFVKVSVQRGGNLIHLEQLVRTGQREDMHLALDHVTEKVHELMKVADGEH